MSEEKKVLTPEEIAMTFDLESDSVENPIEVLIRLIREYGEQQYTLGSHALFKEISAKEGLE